MIFNRALNRIRNETPGKILTLRSTDGWGTLPGQAVNQTNAMKVSTVNRCVEVISDSIAKLPMFVMNGETKERVNHRVNYLLSVRPNSKMTPFVFKKLIETYRLLWGNAYIWLPCDSRGRVTELIPLPADYTVPYVDDDGALWYVTRHPRTGEYTKFHNEEIIHLKGYSADGLTGVSVLSRAAEVINTGKAQQTYENKFYTQNGRPSGVLAVEGQLNKEAKDKIREEWHQIHGGADNYGKIAVLDFGMQYQQIGMSQKDAQFVESKTVGVEDMCRFFGVPLHKAFAGKQSYNSNEQNAIEYVTGTLHPIVVQYEQEFTYKALLNSEIARSLEVKANMAAEMRGDDKSRAEFYKAMREIGAFSVNDIRELEDRPKVAGGETHYASLNYVPLEDFRELSKNRNQPVGGGDDD